MPLLSSDELAALRAVQTATLPSTCTIQRATVAADAIGTAVETWATVASDVPCRLAPATTSEEPYGARVPVIGQFILTVAYGTDLGQDDRAVVLDHTYQVVGLLRGSWATCQRAAVVEVE